MYHDGTGLYLGVENSGAKRWVQRVTIDGKRHNLGLGDYPAVSLADVRDMLLDNAKAIKEGVTRWLRSGRQRKPGKASDTYLCRSRADCDRLAPPNLVQC